MLHGIQMARLDFQQQFAARHVYHKAIHRHFKLVARLRHPLF